MLCYAGAVVGKPASPDDFLLLPRIVLATLVHWCTLGFRFHSKQPPAFLPLYAEGDLTTGLDWGKYHHVQYRKPNIW